MKFIKIFLTSLCLIITTVANADVASQALNKVSEKISEYTIGLIPGDGTTEFDIFSDTLFKAWEATSALATVVIIKQSDVKNIFINFIKQIITKIKKDWY